MTLTEPKHLRHSRFLHPAAWLLRASLGLWFASSGSTKIFVSGLSKFTQDVANYKLVTPPLDAITAYTVPWAEVIVGLCLLTGLWRRATLIAASTLVTSFATAIAWAWHHQLNIACGCHGGSEPIHYWWKTAELASYYLAFLLLWQHERHHPTPANQAHPSTTPTPPSPA